ncbi:MAG: MerR family transcriptional regulator [Kofleriaceae bacterium]
MSESWTIHELAAQVARALDGDDGPDSARVRAVPDERAIRYYTTLGLLDRPPLRGRTALYGPRHLAQLVAIKRAQAAGQSLAEIQRTLPTLDDAALTRASGVPLVPRQRARGRADFWRTPPAAPAPPPAAPAAPPVTLRAELDLGAGVRLSLSPTRPITDADLAALIAAAAPLIAELNRRHLVVDVPTLEATHDPDPR